MTAYADVLGTSLSALPEPLQRFHKSDGVFEGRITVERPRNAILRSAGTLAGFPPAVKDAPLTLSKTSTAKGERWRRQIGARHMSSVQWAIGGALHERVGPVTAITRFDTQDGEITMTLVGWCFLGLPMPLAIGPRISTRESADSELYTFEVTVRPPFLATPLVRYAGHLVTAATSEAKQA
ncbi:MAG: DUF4166 domain-containing protein [Rhodobacteraceae bacterium]|nr:DUF4166 domain-containing protein [Paracoccaceae bacterium]